MEERTSPEQYAPSTFFKVGGMKRGRIYNYAYNDEKQQVKVRLHSLNTDILETSCFLPGIPVKKD